MKLIKNTLLSLIGLAFLCCGKVEAQQRPLIDVAIDSAAILIGEQTVLHLTVTADQVTHSEVI